MQIQNNLPSMNASRNQGIAEGKVKKALEKLSSGYRIVRAGDDAAGLAISESMRSRINGLNQAMSNIDDGINLTNVGEGALTEIHDMLHRMETLAVEAANGTYHTGARENLEMEREELLAEIDRIGSTTDFGGIPLFSQVPDTDTIPAGWTPPEQDKGNPIPLQIGATETETLDVARFYIGSRELLLDKTDFTSVEKANASMGILADAVEAINDVRGTFGAAYSHLVHTHNNLSVTAENMTAAESQIRDTDMNQEFISYTAANITLQASNAMLSQANAVPDMIIKMLNS